MINKVSTKIKQITYILWLNHLICKSQGVVSEFRIAEAEDPKLEKCKYNFEWLYANGLLLACYHFLI